MNRLLMVNGSWPKRARPGPPTPLLPLSHEPLTINTRLINELFVYILGLQKIPKTSHLQNPIFQKEYV